MNKDEKSTSRAYSEYIIIINNTNDVSDLKKVSECIHRYEDHLEVDTKKVLDDKIDAKIAIIEKNNDLT